MVLLQHLAARQPAALLVVQLDQVQDLLGVATGN
jgi:hypothetical protein